MVTNDHAARSALIRLLPLGSLTLILGACAISHDPSSATVPTSPQVPVSAPAGASPPTLSIYVTPQRTAMYADETFRLTLIAVGAGREPVFLDSTTRWTTSDTTVATLSYSKDTQTDLIGIRPGTVTIRASVGVYTTSVVLTVLPAPILTNGGFVVEAFSVIEYQYSSAPNRWYYAPQLRVRGSTVSDLKLIQKLTFEFSGVPNVAECNASIVIAGMQPNDLFREIYGDYQLEFDFGGKLPSGTTALAHITLTEGTGTQVLTVAGPVVSGALPTTYTGGNPQWLCR